MRPFSWSPPDTMINWENLAHIREEWNSVFQSDNAKILVPQDREQSRQRATLSDTIDAAYWISPSVAGTAPDAGRALPKSCRRRRRHADDALSTVVVSVFHSRHLPCPHITSIVSMAGRFESSRPEDRPLANVGMVELLRHRISAQVAANARVRVRAHGAVRFETAVGA